jgi:hypothetical protein
VSIPYHIPNDRPIKLHNYTMCIVLWVKENKFIELCEKNYATHSYDILGAGMLWKPKEARKFVKIRENSLKFVKIRVEECFDKVLYHVNS